MVEQACRSSWTWWCPGRFELKPKRDQCCGNRDQVWVGRNSRLKAIVQNPGHSVLLSVSPEDKHVPSSAQAIAQIGRGMLDS
ncbi:MULTISPECIES: hypothetical protein [unclassified Mycolicibacterium]|uniref:hypothetical protein n=1 Tax=unclassified Mycolicibacterium TaxID=2636767 RepID=UPI0012DF7922|nr:MULTISPECIES: hypothetical protein [unclassified Mycolicibacterium]MUL84777.1 hypothetical protein [Mycolicibacterium sp. CBMA 329]MUL88552.1 hypothetical protein [Mycolicibacterium sp. CBMA 331]MUM00108.1 hypothetical protein [Mycolicibacterium sp. CBMA 334]MUM29155.1 hypothetical protein [Mycolicibacterium sp. CBMA 295]MUM40199.1 hypothetical protein [Mycolicibacterium sp. CBMA 247]